MGWDDRQWPTHEGWTAELRRLADNLDYLRARLDDDGAIDEERDGAVADEVFTTLRRAWGHLRLN